MRIMSTRDPKNWAIGGLFVSLVLICLLLLVIDAALYLRTEAIPDLFANLTFSAFGALFGVISSAAAFYFGEPTFGTPRHTKPPI
jgi:hypothetical protein